MTKIRRHSAFRVIALAVAALAVGHVQGQQAWPAKPLRFVVPSNPGTSSDLLARIVFEPVGQALGQPIVVEARPGAAGTLSIEVVAKAPPDGYSYAIPSLGSLGIASTLYRNLRYDPLKDLAGVANLTSAPNVLAVARSFPATSVRELVELARANPGKFNFAATGGFGTSFHLAWTNFTNLAGIKIVNVPFKVPNDAAQALASGEVQIAMNALNALLPQIKDGTLRPIAVTSVKRMSQLPAVPTGGETGLAGLDVVSWFGAVTRAGTPQQVTDRMSAEALKSLARPDVQEKLANLGFDIYPMGAAEFDAHYRREIAKWAPIVKSTGLSEE